MRYARAVHDELRTLGRTVALLARVAPLAAAGYILLVVLLGLVPVLQAWLLREVVNQIGAHEADAALRYGALYAATLVVLAALNPVQMAVSAWLEEVSVSAVDRELMSAGTKLSDLYRVERPAFGDELRMLEDVPMYLPRVYSAMQQGLGAVISLGGLLVLLGRLQLLIPILLLVLSIPHMVAEYRIHEVQFEVLTDRSRAAREMDYCVQVTTEPGMAKEVRVFGLGDFFLRRLRQRFGEAIREMTRVRLRFLWLGVLFAGLYALAVGGSFGYVAWSVGQGRLSVGDIALYVSAIMQVPGLLVRLRVGAATMHEIVLHVGAFFRLVNTAGPTIAVTPQNRALPMPRTLSTGIELQDVSFTYPEGTAPVLNGASFRIPARKVTALVGHNGAGKSTLVKLLTRMYDPTSGDITLDGRPLRDYDLDSLRARIAVVYQDFAHFSLTLRENIGVGSGSGDHGGVDVERAAVLAGADDVARKLPNGYETQLTRAFEGGVEISGGEWQKVATARGFIRDAAFVILDEPTSALDAEAEEQLFRRFRELIRGRTALIISHRFSTVRMADHIVVLEHGRVLEAGSHDDLVSAGGRYAELFEMQAGRYR